MAGSRVVLIDESAAMPKPVANEQLRAALLAARVRVVRSPLVDQPLMQHPTMAGFLAQFGPGASAQFQTIRIGGKS